MAILDVVSKKIGMEGLPDMLTAGVFYLLVGLYVASAVSVVRRHAALAFLSTV